MNHPRRKVLGGLAAGAAALAWPFAARAQFPDKPVKVVIGYSTGGATDATARLVGRQLEQRLGQPVVYEYKPGAGASIGADFVAKSAPDGYTIGLTDSGPMTIMPNLRKVGYDPLKDLVPLSYVCATGLVLLVHPSVKANNVKELVALAKTEGGKLNYASSGVGSVHHLAGELFKAQAAVKMTHVPYKGAGPALTDLIGGQVPVMFATIGPALQMIQSGRARALGVTSAKRSGALPDVPTIAEQGLAGYEAVLWFMMVAPAALPAPQRTRFEKELATVLADPGLVRDLEKLGNEDVGPRTPQQVSELLRSELAKWGKVIRDAGITLES
ncbi:MAG: tripartite tricarboxylate transporter substrate binding protein [Betaproteobacteria bacterium]|nr:tripartite tricarboxylate transporter substrate binding protein [Betaproteobacteria bacterium]